METILAWLMIVTGLIESGARCAIWDKTPPKWSDVVACLCMVVLPIHALLSPCFSLPGFYTIYLVMCIAQDVLIPAPKGYVNISVRIRFVFFGSIHLTVTGAMALLTPYSLREVLSGQQFMSVGVCITFVLLTLLRFSPLVKQRGVDFSFFTTRKKDLIFLYYFLNLNTVYIFFQSILCEQDPYLELNLGFLMCANLISLLFVCCYLVSLSVIWSHLETEISHGYLSASLQNRDEELEDLRATVQYDQLTHAHSRLYAIETMEKMIQEKVLFSLVYLDLNGLKTVNDIRGHQEGDRYLQEFVQAMGARIRKDDCLARYGGDEFLILFPQCTREQAMVRMDAIRTSLANEPQNFRFGAGIADTREGRTLDELIQVADGRMYADKRRSKEEG